MESQLYMLMIILSALLKVENDYLNILKFYLLSLDYKINRLKLNLSFNKFGYIFGDIPLTKHRGNKARTKNPVATF